MCVCHQWQINTYSIPFFYFFIYLFIYHGPFFSLFIFRYVYRLSDLHERDSNFTEAALSLLLHADTLEVHVQYNRTSNNEHIETIESITIMHLHVGTCMYMYDCNGLLYTQMYIGLRVFKPASIMIYSNSLQRTSVMSVTCIVYIIPYMYVHV